MTIVYQYAQTKYLDVNGTSFAYRELGPRGGIPVVFLHHFTAVIDDWDPRIVDGIATRHHVIVFDNRGVGGSGGTTPSSVPEMAEDAASFIRALGHEKVDIFAFSLGGYVAQALTLAHPELVRKLILTGTGPAGTARDGNGDSRLSELMQEVRSKCAALNKHPKHFLFFPQTEAGQAAANAFLTRLQDRKVDRVKPVSEQTVQAHIEAIKAWGHEDPSRLKEIVQPTFIANGDDDVMVPTERSFELHRLIPDSTLSIYPGSGHGGIFHYHNIFVNQALAFLAC
ncbi:alpha/beta fold hydrolase [Cupriavidus necator]